MLLGILTAVGGGVLRDLPVAEVACRAALASRRAGTAGRRAPHWRSRAPRSWSSTHGPAAAIKTACGRCRPSGARRWRAGPSGHRRGRG
ncbi:MAG: hypothetical protein ACLFTL_08750 [Alphaproteobacteria bacterium]